SLAELQIPRSVPINRQLAAKELYLLRSINKEFGSVFSQYVSDWCLHRSDGFEHGNHVNQRVFELCTSRHKQDVEWVNKNFFGGESVVCVGVSSPRGIKTRKVQKKPSAEYCIELVKYILSSMKNRLDNATENIGERLFHSLELFGYLVEIDDGQNF